MASLPFSEEKNILTIKTVQIVPFRSTMTALKDILLESNIVFQRDGMRIVNMDKTHHIFVHLHLLADNFETYTMKCDKIVVGVNMLHLFKLINSIENTDTLTIYIEESDYRDGVVDSLSLRFDNGSIGQCKILKLKLTEPDPEELHIPDVTYSSVISMRSADFQKIVRDMHNISDKMDIQSVGSELIFTAEGTWASSVLRRSESELLGIVSQQDSAKIIQGTFSLKNLSYCAKCTSLCPQIELYLKNDLPLVILYKVANLGQIRLCLVPL